MKATQLWTIKPLALPESIVCGNGYRITVLTDRLLRLEYEPENRFEDSATQMAICREFPAVPFTSAVQDGRLLFYREGTVTISRDESQSEFHGLDGLSGWYISFNSVNRDILPYALDGEFTLLDGGIWEYLNDETAPAYWKLEDDRLILTTPEGESYLLTVDEENKQLFYSGTNCLIFEPCPFETLDEFEFSAPATVYQQKPSVFSENPLD